MVSEFEMRIKGLGRPYTLIQPDSESWLIYSPAYAPELNFSELESCLSWRQDALRMWGRQIPLPRLTAWQGDPEAVYTYSGIQNDPKPWHPLLKSLRDKLQTDLGLDFNSVLGNRYADGRQHQGFHADDEPELGEKPVIASLSFGENRRFLYKPRDKSRKAERLLLENQSLLLMGGTFQRDWLHALPKMSGVQGARINLTFRQILPKVQGLDRAVRGKSPETAPLSSVLQQ